MPTPTMTKQIKIVKEKVDRLNMVLAAPEPGVKTWWTIVQNAYHEVETEVEKMMGGPPPWRS